MVPQEGRKHRAADRNKKPKLAEGSGGAVSYWLAQRKHDEGEGYLAAAGDDGVVFHRSSLRGKAYNKGLEQGIYYVFRTELDTEPDDA